MACRVTTLKLPLNPAGSITSGLSGCGLVGPGCVLRFLLCPPVPCDSLTPSAMKHPNLLLATAAFALPLLSPAAEPDLVFASQRRQPGEAGLEITAAAQTWKPAETALILCDVWDSHHCHRAVLRVQELSPRLDAVVREARKQGVLIIHAPSGCMKAYEGHPARLRAQAAPTAPNLPEGIGNWMKWIDQEEEKAGYPVDASDGGEDDDPAEHEAWAKELTAKGLNPKAPWTRQIDTIGINGEKDLISDSGVEIWNAMEQRGIRNVFLAGVHANMCVLGRPFGLRQLTRHGKNAILLRDLTDAMYNPAMSPQVSHFRGTELILGHIERHVCPTALSSDVFGGKRMEFSNDPRPILAIMIGEDEYQTWETLPRYAEDQLGSAFRVRYVVPKSGENHSDFANTAELEAAKVLLVSVRRRTPPVAQLDAVRRFVDRGGSVVGIRTASHAFALRDKVPPAGAADWLEWDATVLGGNYQGHHANTIATSAHVISNHPVTEGLPTTLFPTGGSLYQNTPLPVGSTVLLEGQAEGIGQAEPVAWVRKTPAGGRVFYTSLGHSADFKGAVFPLLLKQALNWAAGIPGPER